MSEQEYQPINENGNIETDQGIISEQTKNNNESFQKEIIHQIISLENDFKTSNRVIINSLKKFDSNLDIFRRGFETIEKNMNEHDDSINKEIFLLKKKMLLDFLDIRDRMVNMISSIKSDAPSSFLFHLFGADTFVNNIIESLELLESRFSNLFSSYNITEISTESREFDPNKMKIADLVSDADKSEGEVVEEIKKGYMLNDEIIQPAEVVVCKNNLKGQ